ncbi:MAG TPA: hypothetical protein VLK84_29330 [Longimicrobium sp.]|nr:hypothetical protein [Longimicrobium sp.]
MRIIRSFAALLALVLLAGCGDDGVSPRGIVGHWEFSTETSAILWRRDVIRLELHEDGGFVRDARVFASDGRPGDHLRSYARAEGTYRLAGDLLALQTHILERWDVHDTPVPVQEPGGFGGDLYRARVVGDRLLLEEERDVDGKPVTFYHTFRRVPPPIVSDGRVR